MNADIIKQPPRLVARRWRVDSIRFAVDCSTLAALCQGPNTVIWDFHPSTPLISTRVRSIYASRPIGLSCFLNHIPVLALDFYPHSTPLKFFIPP